MLNFKPINAVNPSMVRFQGIDDPLRDEELKTVNDRSFTHKINANLTLTADSLENLNKVLPKQIELPENLTIDPSVSLQSAKEMTEAANRYRRAFKELQYISFKFTTAKSFFWSRPQEVLILKGDTPGFIKVERSKSNTTMESFLAKAFQVVSPFRLLWPDPPSRLMSDTSD